MHNYHPKVCYGIPILLPDKRCIFHILFFKYFPLIPRFRLIRIFRVLEYSIYSVFQNIPCVPPFRSAVPSFHHSTQQSHPPQIHDVPSKIKMATRRGINVSCVRIPLIRSSFLQSSLCKNLPYRLNNMCQRVPPRIVYFLLTDFNVQTFFFQIIARQTRGIHTSCRRNFLIPMVIEQTVRAKQDLDDFLYGMLETVAFPQENIGFRPLTQIFGSYLRRFIK